MNPSPDMSQARIEKLEYKGGQFIDGPFPNETKMVSGFVGSGLDVMKYEPIMERVGAEAASETFWTRGVGMITELSN